MTVAPVALIAALRERLESDTQAPWRLAPVALVEQGRVAVGDEVGQALLAVRLVEGSGGDVEPQGGLARRDGLPADGVAHAIGKDAEDEAGICGYV